MKNSIQSSDWRLRFVRYLFVMVGVAIIGRLFSLQIINHGRYETLAARQHFFRREIIAERGKIFSDDGTPLATTQDGYLLYLSPPEIENPEEIIYILMKENRV